MNPSLKKLSNPTSLLAWTETRKSTKLKNSPQDIIMTDSQELEDSNYLVI